MTLELCLLNITIKTKVYLLKYFYNEIYYDLDLKFMGISFSNTKKEDLKNFFKKYDENIEIDFYSFTSYKYVFSVYGDLEDDLVTSVFIFEKDYHENY